MSISDYKSVGDSISLAEIGEEPFTIVQIEDSNYEEGNNVTPGVKITTEESFDKDGEKYHKLHTTRTAIVNILKNEKLRSDVAGGKKLGPVKCVKVKSKTGGKDYFDLEDAE